MSDRNANYHVIYKHTYFPRKSFKIMYDPSETWPWCVEHFGNGYYFSTARECLAYCYGRGWIVHPDIAILAGRIAEILSADSSQVEVK